MYLLGATLTKLLATVVAVMTVAAGLPSSQCLCPDGRVKFFCQGTASGTSGCCCAAGDTPSSESKPCCGGVKTAPIRGSTHTKKHSCCVQAQGESEGPGRHGSGIGAKAGCCVQTLATVPAVDTVAATGTPVQQAIDTLALGEPPLLLPPVTAAVAARPPSEHSSRTIDLVVVLHRFLC